SQMDSAELTREHLRATIAAMPAEQRTRALQNTRLWQEIQDHPEMQRLRNEHLRGQITNNEYHSETMQLQNELLNMQVQEGISPATAARIERDATRTVDGLLTNAMSPLSREMARRPNETLEQHATRTTRVRQD